MRMLRWAFGSLVAVTALAGCYSIPAVSPSAPPATGPMPTLLTWSKNPTSDFRTDALAGGVLGVNDAGCFTLHTEILMAPPGSAALPDGTGVEMAGYGIVHIGEEIRNLPAAYWDITPGEPSAPGIAECLSASAPEKEYVVIWDR